MSHFPAFWARYPVKTDRKDAEKRWKDRKLDDQWDRIQKYLDWAPKNDKKWKEGFILGGATFVNKERWNDHDKHMYPPRLTSNPLPQKQDPDPKLSKWAQYSNFTLWDLINLHNGICEYDITDETGRLWLRTGTLAKAKNPELLIGIVRAKNDLAQKAESDGDWENADYASTVTETFKQVLSDEKLPHMREGP